MTPSLRIAFLHPELGLGGAERLVVDAAVELQARGHKVAIFTSTHDRKRSFPETLDGTLQVREHGAFIPSRVAGRLQAACTIARLSWTAAALAAGRDRYDVIVCDLVPYAIPLLRALKPGRNRPKIVYYCHYPDQLLAPPRRGWYRLYRAPLDRLEVPAMHAADRVVVNSRFTADTLAGISGGTAEVVYPGVAIERYADVPAPTDDERLLLIVSRFDKRKNLPLAVEALAYMRTHAPAAFAQTTLVIAGGLDPSRAEDRAAADAVETAAERLGVRSKLILKFSPTETERLELLTRAMCVVHTAPDEHFGLVPVEAMAAGRPVIAVAAAGPLETIVDGETGFLRPPTAEGFGTAMADIVSDPARAARMGTAARTRAARFSRTAFGAALETVLLETVARA